LNGSSLRMWIELTLAGLTACLLVATLLSGDWIELVFHIDPDAGTGSVERVVVVSLFAVTMTFAVLARLEWRRLQKRSAARG
jgi:hypothetical protein